jgi:hypothetical protein
MPHYLIERDLPGAGYLTAEELRAIARRSNEVLAAMAPRAQWQHSFVTQDKLFCLYVAEDEVAIHDHATAGGFPVTAVRQVIAIIDPVTGE